MSRVDDLLPAPRDPSPHIGEIEFDAQMSRVDDLLLEWEDRRDRGEPVGAAVLCPDDPALQRVLSARIRLLEAYDKLTSTGPPVSPPAVPTRVGKYEIVGTVGSGGWESCTRGRIRFSGGPSRSR